MILSHNLLIINTIIENQQSLNNIYNYVFVEVFLKASLASGSPGAGTALGF
jgi:hypothetical protein